MKKLLFPTAAAILALGLSACGSTTSSDSSTSEKSTSSAAQESKAAAPAETSESTSASADSSAKKITFKVTSSAGKGTVMYGAGGSMNTQEFNGSFEGTVDTKTTEAVTVTTTGDYMAQENKVTCEILVNGESVKTAEGSGQSGSASCLYMPGM